MQPENIQPTFGPEQPLPAEKPTVERSPQEVASPEAGLNVRAERSEQAAEARAAVADAAAQVVPVADPTIAPVANPDPAITMPASGPAVASDDDVIEKEWVDRAKEIVHKTKDNPFERGNQVSQLQKDYQKKRYGRELGVA